VIRFFSTWGWRAGNHRQRRDWLLQCANNKGKEIESLNIIFMRDEELLEMNQRHLNHDDYTDIITFDLRARIPQDPIHGELYISVDRVKENARSNGHLLAEELDRVMVHGLLHLLGFKDKKEKDKADMRSAEDACLAVRAWKQQK